MLPTGHIVIAFCRTFKMCLFVCPLGTLESHGWAHWKCTQHVPTGHIGVTWQGIFKMYSAFNHWAHWSHMLTVLSMFLPCTQWVFGPLSPVRQRSSPAGSYRLPSPERMPEIQESNRGDEDGRSRVGIWHSGEPRKVRGETSNISSEVSSTSLRNIYTKCSE